MSPAARPKNSNVPEEILDMFRQMSNMNSSLIKNHADLLAKHDLLLQRVINIEEQLTRLLGAARNSTGENPSTPFPVTTQFSSPTEVHDIVLHTITEQKLLKEKSLRAVVENLPESSADDLTVQHDIEVIESIAEHIGVIADLQADMIHRHGQKRENGARILKVPFSNVPARDRFIRFFNQSKPETLKNLPRSVKCRRDLTPTELKIHHAKKKECFQLNKDANALKYFYRDLRIFANPQPYRPLPLMNRAQDGQNCAPVGQRRFQDGHGHPPPQI